MTRSATRGPRTWTAAEASQETQDWSSAVARARGAAARQTLGATSVKTYRRYFEGPWTKACGDANEEPLAASAASVKALFDSASTFMWSPGHLDAILCSVRYFYRLNDKTAPHDVPAAKDALKALKKQHARRLVETKTPAPPVTTASIADFRRICTMPLGDQDRLAMALRTLLAIDLNLPSGAAAAMDLGSLVVTPTAVEVPTEHGTHLLACRRNDSRPFEEMCAHCLVSELTTDGRAARCAEHSLRSLMRRVCERWPLARLLEVDGQVAISIETDDEHLRTATRQGLYYSAVPSALCHRRTQLAIKLAMMRGLATGDIYRCLLWSKVSFVGEDVVLDLPRTVRAAAGISARATIRRALTPSMCAVRALREWKALSEATAPDSVDVLGESHVLVVARGNRLSLGRPVSSSAQAPSLHLVLEGAGLSRDLICESFRLGYTALALAQGASEDDVQFSLRLARPKDATRASVLAGSQARILRSLAEEEK